MFSPHLQIPPGHLQWPQKLFRVLEGGSGCNKKIKTPGSPYLHQVLAAINRQHL